jgi:hypothetical protein
MTPPQTFDIQAPANVYDFTLFKLGKFVDECLKSNQDEQGQAFEEAIDMYVAERIAIQWHKGQPFAIVFNAEDSATLRGMGGIDREVWENLSKETLEGLGDQIDEDENPNDSE